MKYKILDIQWKEASLYGHPCTLISGHLGYSGSLQLLLDRRPALEDFTFKRYGNMFFAEVDSFVRIFRHEPGTTKGFAGSEYTLKFEDGEHTFKGSLWDPTSFDNTSGVPEYRAVSITDDKDIMKKGYTFYAGYITKKLYDELMELVKNSGVEPEPVKGRR